MLEIKEEHLHIRVAKGMVWNYINKILEFGLAACFSVLVGRTLGPKNYGAYNLIMTFTTTLLLFFSFGFESVLNKFVPHLNRTNSFSPMIKLYENLLIKRFLILLVLSVGVYFVSFFFANYFSERAFLDYRFLIIVIFIAIGLRDMVLAFFTSLLKIRELTIIKTISQVFGLGVVIVLFLLFSPSLKYALWSFLLSIVFLLFMSWLTFNNRIKINDSNKMESLDNKKTLSAEILKFGLYVWLINISTFLINGQVNILLLGVMLKDTLQVGYYSTALLFGYLPGVFISALAGIFLPVLSEVSNGQGKKGLSKIVNELGKMLILTIIPIILFLGWFARPIVIVMFGEKYLPCVPMVQIYSMFSSFGILALTHLATNTLYTIGQEKKVLLIRVFSGIINIGLVFVLVPRHGAIGAVLSLCISVFITQFIEFALVSMNVKNFYPLLFALKVLAGALSSLFIVGWFKTGGLVSISLIFILFIGLIFVFYKVLRLFSEKDKKLLADLHPFSAFIARWL